MSGDIVGAAKTARDALDYLTFGVTILGVAVLILYTTATLWQAWLTKAALALTRKSNESAEKNNEITKRAWLVVSLEPREDAMKEIAASRITEVLVLSNLGGVPATDVEVWGRFDLWPNPPGIPDIIPQRAGLFPVSGIVIGHQERHKLLVHDWDIPDADVERIGAPGLIFVFYCEISYRDIYNRPRATVACLQQATRFWDNRWWVYAPKHNKLT